MGFQVGLRFGPGFRQQPDPAPEASFEQQPTHVGMPSLSAYLSPQLGTGYAPVAEHDDGHIMRDRRGQFPEQFHRGVYPGAGLSGVADAPSYGNGATAVENADDDGGGLVSLEGGINSQGEAVGVPPGQHPPEQRSEAKTHVKLSLAGPGTVAAIVEPLPEVLAQVIPLVPGREGRGHGVLASAASENSATHPQNQARQLCRGEVRVIVQS